MLRSTQDESPVRVAPAGRRFWHTPSDGYADSHVVGMVVNGGGPGRAVLGSHASAAVLAAATRSGTGTPARGGSDAGGGDARARKHPLSAGPPPKSVSLLDSESPVQACDELLLAAHRRVELRCRMLEVAVKEQAAQARERERTWAVERAAALERASTAATLATAANERWKRTQGQCEVLLQQLEAMQRQRGDGYDHSHQIAILTRQLQDLRKHNEFRDRTLKVRVRGAGRCSRASAVARRPTACLRMSCAARVSCSGRKTVTYALSTRLRRCNVACATYKPRS